MIGNDPDRRGSGTGDVSITGFANYGFHLHHPPPVNGHTTPAKNDTQTSTPDAFTASLFNTYHISRAAQVNGAATRKLAKEKIRASRISWEGGGQTGTAPHGVGMGIDRWEEGQ